MKIIPFRKKGRVYELLDEITLDNNQHSIQVVGKGAVRVFITEKSGGLVIEIPDVRTRFRVDPDKREFILFKKAQEGQDKKANEE